MAWCFGIGARLVAGEVSGLIAAPLSETVKHSACHAPAIFVRTLALGRRIGPFRFTDLVKRQQERRYPVG